MDVFNQNQIFQQYISRLQTDFILVDHGLCPDWIRPPHKRRRDSIYLILDGTGHITINGMTIYPEKNDMVLLPRGSVVSLYAEPETCYNKYWCDFLMHFDGISLFDVIDFPNIVQLEDISRAKELFEQLDILRLKTDAKSALLLKASLLELISLFLENEKNEIREQTSAPFADKIKDFINEHLSEKLSVKMLADEMHFNEKYFIDLFKQHFSTTPAQYIKTLRLETVKHALLYSNDKITGIAERTGYANPQQLSKDFKAYTGFSPSEFRKRFQ